MVTHNELKKMTEELPEDVRDREVFLAVPSKFGYMLHQIAKAELLTLNGDMEGDIGVLVSDPVAAYHLDNNLEREENVSANTVPYIEYKFMEIDLGQEEDAKEKEQEVQD
jgi:hypothetical protein